MKVTQEFFASLPDFNNYFNSIQTLFESGKTTGADQSEAMLNYTKLSIARTKRGLKTFKAKPELIQTAMKHKAKNWLLISEAWCGDAGNIIPMVKKVAEEVEDVNLKIMLRDEHPEIMENYLTNGAKSIPILVLFDEQFNEIRRWGPRPAPAQKMVLDNKKNVGAPSEEFKIELQKWYIKDKAETLQNELIQVFQ